MIPVVFEASALPSALQATRPDLLTLKGPDGGVQVKYPNAEPEWIDAVARGLLGAGPALSARPADGIIAALGRVGRRFLDLSDPIREEALELLPATSGLSPEMSAAVLDGMAADWTEDRLLRLVRSELGTEKALDGFERAPEASAMAVGPRLCVQIVAGSVPGVGVSALVRSLLLKSPTLLKPGRGDVVLPVLFARALREADPGLADATAVVYWPGGEQALEDAALARADVVVAYGSDETVRDLRARAPVTARFVAYHHRVSVGIVGREALELDRLAGTAAEVAEAVALFDRAGCVSPQVVYVETGGAATPQAFAEALADELRHMEDRLPSGPLDAAEASDLHQLRGTAELLATAGEVSLLHGGEASWTVISEGSAGELPGATGRVIRLRGISDAAEVPTLLVQHARHLQTVGVVGLGERLEATARALGHLGASRVVPFSAMAFPPPWWHHDGRGPLRDLVRWVDLEESG